MRYYLAPMEGVTGFQYRATYHKFYGDADRYFTPFLVGKKLSNREKAEVDPENNEGMELVPQILTNRADEFVYIANRLKEHYGYEEVNLNLGCPSGTVASKNRGSGFLNVPRELDEFLDYIYTHSKVRISIKTRIGVIDADGWEDIMKMYLQYPMSELIIHPRTQRQGYGGLPDDDAFGLAVGLWEEHEKNHSHIPLCYNGNVNSIEDRDRVVSRFPQIDAIMCGRGLIADPMLIGKLKQKEPKPEDFGSGNLRNRSADEVEHFRAFIHSLYLQYKEGNLSEKNMLFKVKELWFYWSRNFPEPQQVLRSVQKSTSCLEYEAAVNNAFRSLKTN